MFLALTHWIDNLKLILPQTGHQMIKVGPFSDVILQFAIISFSFPGCRQWGLETSAVSCGSGRPGVWGNGGTTMHQHPLGTSASQYMHHPYLGTPPPSPYFHLQHQDISSLWVPAVLAWCAMTWTNVVCWESVAQIPWISCKASSRMTPVYLNNLNLQSMHLYWIFR